MLKILPQFYSMIPIIRLGACAYELSLDQSQQMEVLTLEYAMSWQQCFYDLPEAAHGALVRMRRCPFFLVVKVVGALKRS